MIDPVSLGTILASLLPTAGYVTKKITDYYTGGKSADRIEERKADAAMLDAISKIDNADGASSWVINIRALQRPIVVFTVLFNWTLMTLGLVHVDLQLYVIVANLASAVMFYLFGDRTLMYSLQSFNKKLTGN